MPDAGLGQAGGGFFRSWGAGSCGFDSVGAGEQSYNHFSVVASSAGTGGVCWLLGSGEDSFCWAVLQQYPVKFGGWGHAAGLVCYKVHAQAI